MVESTESRERDNISFVSGFDEASRGRITVERPVRPGAASRGLLKFGGGDSLVMRRSWLGQWI